MSTTTNDDFLVVLLDAGAKPHWTARNHCSPLQTLLATSTDPKHHLTLVTEHAHQGYRCHIATHLRELRHYAIISCSGDALEVNILMV